MYIHASCRDIVDSMMPELCEHIVKLGDKVKHLEWVFLDCIELIFDERRNNLHRLQSNKISSAGMILLFDTLRTTNSTISSVSLRKNFGLNDQYIPSLGEYIKTNKSLASLDLGSTSASDTTIELLAPYLDGNVTLKRIELRGCTRVTDKSMPLLINTIKSSHVEYIGIIHLPITQKNVLYILLLHNVLKNKSSTMVYPD